MRRDPPKRFQCSKVQEHDGVEQAEEPEERWSASAVHNLSGCAFDILNAAFGRVLVLVMGFCVFRVDVEPTQNLAKRNSSLHFGVVVA